MASDRDTLAEIIYATSSYSTREQSEEAANRLLAAGVRPPAREITDPAELDTLPGRSIVLAENQAWTLRWPGNGWTVCPSCEITYCAGDLLDYTGDSVTVLWTPGGSE